MPAKVNIGDACNHPLPVHRGSPLGTMATLRWRTTTPLGRPVVPDVYMRSAMSSPPTGTWNAPSSGSVASSQGTSPASSRAPAAATGPVVTRWRSSGSSDRAASSVGVVDAPLMATTAPAWPRTYPSSRVTRRVLVGTATAPALWTAE